MQVNSIVQTVLFFCLMGCAGYMDIRKREIPTALWTLVAMISLLDFRVVNLLGILAALPFLIMAIIDPTAIGGGDIKLMTAVGLVIGLWKTLIGACFGLAAVIVFHGILKLFRRDKVKEKKRISYPLAPFLAAGFIFTYFL